MVTFVGAAVDDAVDPRYGRCVRQSRGGTAECDRSGCPVLKLRMIYRGRRSVTFDATDLSADVTRTFQVLLMHTAPGGDAGRTVGVNVAGARSNGVLGIVVERSQGLITVTADTLRIRNRLAPSW